MKLRLLCCIVFIACASAVCLPASGDTLTQISTYGALQSGIYDGNTTLGSLKARGDFGLGTFNGLDGEMVFLNDTIYQAQSSGVMVRPPDSALTPFAAVTFFHATHAFDIMPGLSMAQLGRKLDSMLPTLNIFYAVKITGVFNTVKARSIPRQRPPYRSMLETVKEQKVWNFPDAHGTIVGYRCPAFAHPINVPGWHLHFISDTRDKGGHVLDLTTGTCRAEVEELRNFSLTLPDDSAFSHADFSRYRLGDVNKIEK